MILSVSRMPETITPGKTMIKLPRPKEAIWRRLTLATLTAMFRDGLMGILAGATSWLTALAVKACVLSQGGMWSLR